MKSPMERAKELLPELTEWRHYLHQHPELGTKLPMTTAFVEEKLRQMGYQPEYICEGGLVAVLEGGKPGKTILLRADMDALPMDEENTHPFKSQTPGAAHTCGHDIHTAMLLGAAKLLMEDREELCGRVKFMFQPNEEGPGGALLMVESGVLENPHVDAAMGFHANVGQVLASGEIGYRIGPIMASTDVFSIQVTGKGGHGARPEEGIDPINILMHIHDTLQTINSRERPQQEPVVLTIGQISAGDAPNTIPAEGVMSGTIRAFNEEVRQFVKRRVVEISQGVASTLGGKAEVTFKAGTAATINDPKVAGELLKYIGEIVPAEHLVEQKASMGSEDFAEVSLRVPSGFFNLGMGNASEGYSYSVHSPKVDFDESAMPLGTALFLHCAKEWLKQNS